MITKKQKDFLNNLLQTYGKEPLPSFERICADLGFKSKNSVWQYVQKLIEAGLIKERNNRFFLSSELFGVDYYHQGIRAGFPSPAEDHTVEKISFDDLLVKRPDSTFTVKIVGDSMIEAGIHEGDIAIVEKGNSPRNGDIVIAMVDGEFTVKFFKQKGNEIILEPANSAYPEIKIRDELQIFGIVTGIVRKIKS